MKCTEFSLEYCKADIVNKTAVPVIILAGGNSSRMSGINKIFAEVCGVPVIVRTMLAFERSAFISKIIVVTREDSVASISKFADNYMISKLCCVTIGGKTRQESVLNGLKQLSDNDSYVLIHDGARPFVNGTVIDRVVNSYKESKCVICGIACKDTMKIVKENTVKETPNRSTLIAVQTPQRLSIKAYLPILEKECENPRFTDDASIMESAGFAVNVVDGDENNIKITTPFDLKIAEIIVKGEV